MGRARSEAIYVGLHGLACRPNLLPHPYRHGPGTKPDMRRASFLTPRANGGVPSPPRSLICLRKQGVDRLAGQPGPL